MGLTEKTRHDLHTRLEDVLGPEPADTLMSMLPPVGWADVATKRDLDVLQRATKRDLDALQRDINALGEATNLRMEAMEHRIVAGYRAETSTLSTQLSAQTRTMFFALAGFLIPYAGAIIAAAKLL
ncbi:MAG: hypothetical protein ACRDIU_06715 [Actinomycetota bacterium]